MTAASIAKVPSLRSPQALRDRLEELDCPLPVDDEIEPAPGSPMAQILQMEGVTLSNRWCIQPMEGWDGETDGAPSPLTRRRWRRFGRSGAALIWGGEAVAVSSEGRANPNQLVLNDRTASSIASLRDELLAGRMETAGETGGMMIGLQLTHSGRFCRPFSKERMEPRILFRHPLLDRKFGVPEDHPLLSDEELDELTNLYIQAARRAAEMGFDFVDIKHCHGYLGHELLGAHTRPGRYGGSFENRTRFLARIAAGIRSEAPGLQLGVRLSAFDLVPFRPDPDLSAPGGPGPGIPDEYAALLPYRYGFGVDPADPLRADLTETVKFLELLRGLGIRLVNLTAGSPYYNPHIQRPAIYPPSDGYQPPEDPLVGCARQIQTVRRLKQHFPDLLIAGSAYSYFQDYVPHVAQAVVREGWVDCVGLGRMVLSYPELPHDTLTSGTMNRRLICRTFSDCTTAPRNGMVSGCYPLDPFYKERPERIRLKTIKGKD